MNRVMKVSLIIISMGVSVFPLFAQRSVEESGGPLQPEQAAYDVRFYELALTIDPETRSIVGSNRVVFTAIEPLSQLLLDLDPRFTIDSVITTIDEKRRRSDLRRNGAQTAVDLGTELPAGASASATLHYRGRPREAPNPPWDGGFTWKTTASGEPWVSVSCENSGADLWWPCKDHPSDEPDSMALNFTVPAELVCVSNGRLRAVVEHADGTQTFCWFVSTPINNYGAAFYLAPYERIGIDHAGMTGEPIETAFWSLPEDRERHQALIEEIPQHLAFFEELLGPYPFRADKYAAVQAPYLGMEHQSCIAYGALPGYKYGGYGLDFDGLHLHELAHEWWGNMLTAADWKDYWLHEAFATYMEALYAERLFGEEGYRKVMSTFRGSIRNRAPIANRTSLTAAQAYHGDIYFKGAWVLHTLRKFVGDEPFFQILQNFLYPRPELKYSNDGSACRLVSTEEWIQTAEATSGPLRWFFEQYLYQNDLPQLLVYLKDQTLHLQWKTDVQEFPLPVPVQIGERRVTVEMSGGAGAVRLEPFVPPVIDPEDTILKTVVQTSFVDGSELPESFELGQNYPNPFNASTTIPFRLPSESHVELALYNLKGEQVALPAVGVFPAGASNVTVDTLHLPSGVYTYQLTAGGYNAVKQMTIVR